MKPSDEWYVFAKIQRLAREDRIITTIAQYFGFKERDVICSTEWESLPRGFEHYDMIYIWIKKDAFERFQQIFKLNIY